MAFLNSEVCFQGIEYANSLAVSYIPDSAIKNNIIDPKNTCVCIVFHYSPMDCPVRSVVPSNPGIFFGSL